MIVDPKVSLFELISSMSKAVDLISSDIVGHHKRVAYIAVSIAQELGLSIKEQNNILYAGLIHDIGAFSLKERIDLKRFDTVNPNLHAEIGYRLLRGFEPFSEIAKIIKYHHFHWNNGFGVNDNNEKVPIGSFILHISDRIETLLEKTENPLKHSKEVVKKIVDKSNKVFAPKLVEVFRIIAEKEYFWLDIISPELDRILSEKVYLSSMKLGLKTILEYSMVFSRIIDFRSKFTATHSHGVAVTSQKIAQLLDFSPRECLYMRIAGYLHDLGKLAIPNEILEKPDVLNEQEFNIIRSHTYYTFRILENINGFEKIREWASFHHERMDGNGYPFHHNRKSLSLGSRIMAVADVFTAVTEDRPYRRGMAPKLVLKVLNDFSKDKLDPEIVDIAKSNFNEIRDNLIEAQKPQEKKYKEFKK